MSGSRFFLVSAALLVAGSPVARAQSTGQTIGLTAGINLASVSGSDSDASSRTGIRFGAFAIRELSDRMAVQPEAVFTSKGASFDNGDLVINYLQVPVLLRFTFPSTNSSMTPVVVVGPAFAFKIGCTIEPDNGGSSIDCGPTSTDVAGTDLSVLFGAGARFGANELGIRYDFGISNVNEGINEVKSRTISLVFSYAFPRR